MFSTSEPKARADVLRHASTNAKKILFGELEKDDDGSNLLEALSNCTMKNISRTVSIIQLVDGNFNSRMHGSKMCFIRDFY